MGMHLSLRILQYLLEFNYCRETSKYIVEILNPIKKEKREAYVDKIIEELGKRNGKT